MGLLGDIALGLAGMALDALTGESGNSTSPENEEKKLIFHSSNQEEIKAEFLKWNEILLKIISANTNDITFGFTKIEEDKFVIGFEFKDMTKILCLRPGVGPFFGETYYLGNDAIFLSLNFSLCYRDSKEGERLLNSLEFNVREEDPWFPTPKDFFESTPIREDIEPSTLKDIIIFLFEDDKIFENFAQARNKLLTIQQEFVLENQKIKNFIIEYNNKNYSRKQILELTDDEFLKYLEGGLNRTDISDRNLFYKYISKWNEIFQKTEKFQGAISSGESTTSSDISNDTRCVITTGTLIKDNLSIDYLYKAFYGTRVHIKPIGHSILFKYHYSENDYLEFNWGGGTLKLSQNHKNELLEVDVKACTENLYVFFLSIGRPEIGEHYLNFLKELRQIKENADNTAKNDALDALDNI